MYKNSIKIFITTVSIFIITACGGGGTSESIGGDEKPTQPTAIHMEIEKTYTMKKGQTIVRKEEPTKIVVHTDITSGKNTAELISGKADIE
jgi:hypothetical protein